MTDRRFTIIFLFVTLAGEKEENQARNQDIRESSRWHECDLVTSNSQGPSGEFR